VTNKELNKYLPLEKSWIIRMGLLDLLNNGSQIKTFLDTQENLGSDLLALKRVVQDWGSDRPLNVGESGTLYRFLLFISWNLNLKKSFIIAGTLKDRQVTQDPMIINLSQKELLELDGKTSQWASAKAIIGDGERLVNPPHLLDMTYEAIRHWHNRTSQNLDWEPNIDRTIKHQAEAFLGLLETGKTSFTPKQAEDYCFARALDLITKEEGEERWPALKNHESDRIESMEEELNNVKEGRPIISKDHRVVQAIAIWAKVNKKDVHFEHPESVNKTWPLFWSFLNSV